VLNAQAVEFAKATGIAIYARATASPLPGADPSADGTVVRKYPPRMPGVVVGVASERDVLLLEVDQENARRADELFATLDAHGVAGKQLHVDARGLSMVVSRENLHEEGRVRHALAQRFGGGLRIDEGRAAVSVIGAGINAAFDNIRRGTATLLRAGIAPAAMSTSSFRITWMVDRGHVEEAVRLLHAAFLEHTEPVP